jgi:hypothetical protein
LSNPDVGLWEDIKTEIEAVILDPIWKRRRKGRVGGSENGKWLDKTGKKKMAYEV